MQNWVAHPRIINKKKKDIVECVFQVKSSSKAYQLYQNQKDLCDKLSMKVSSKNTDMFYVQRIGFLTGPNVKLSSPMNYVQEINYKAEIDRGCVEIKKKVTFEKGTSSKVLMVCAI